MLKSTYPESAPAPLSIIGSAVLAGETRPAPGGARKFEWNAAENRFEASWFLEDGDLLLGGWFAVKRYDVGHLR